MITTHPASLADKERRSCALPARVWSDPAPAFRNMSPSALRFFFGVGSCPWKQHLQASDSLANETGHRTLLDSTCIKSPGGVFLLIWKTPTTRCKDPRIRITFRAMMPRRWTPASMYVSWARKNGQLCVWPIKNALSSVNGLARRRRSLVHAFLGTPAQAKPQLFSPLLLVRRPCLLYSMKGER